MFNVLKRCRVKKPFQREGKANFLLVSFEFTKPIRFTASKVSETAEAWSHLFSSYHDTDQKRPPLVSVCLQDKILRSLLFQHWLCISLDPQIPILYLIKTTKCIWLKLHPPWQASHRPQAVLGWPRCRDQSWGYILELHNLSCLWVCEWCFFGISRVSLGASSNCQIRTKMHTHSSLRSFSVCVSPSISWISCYCFLKRRHQDAFSDPDILSWLLLAGHVHLLSE